MQTLATEMYKVFNNMSPTILNGIFASRATPYNLSKLLVSEAATRGVLWKKGVLRNFAKFTGKHLCRSLFLIKLQASGLQLYQKRNSGTVVFLWTLRNSKNTFIYRTPLAAASADQEFELHKLKPIIRKFQKRKVHQSCTDNIWGADLCYWYFQ